MCFRRAERGPLQIMMKTATLIHDAEYTIGWIPRLYGFTEHLGCAVYGGIYEPEHPLADKLGFRRDVPAMERVFGRPVVRYSGENMFSDSTG